MTTTKFSGNKVALGAAIFLFCSLGFLACYQAGFALFPDTYGVDVALVSTALTGTTIVGFLSSLIYATLDNRIHVRGLMYLSVVVILIAALGLKFLSGFVGLVIIFVIMGFGNTTGTYAVVTEVISSWFVEKRADKIAMAMGAGSFGMAAYQYIAGQLFSLLGLRDGYFVLGIATAVILALVTKFMIVANTPEEAGESALGSTVAQDVAGAPAEELPEAGNVWKNPAFLLSCAARILGAGGVMFVSMYATMFFGNAGMDLATAATLLSVMTLLNALYTFVSGKVIGAIGVRPYLVLVLVAAALCNVAMVIYEGAPGTIVLVAIVALFTVGFSYSTVNNLIADQLFLPQDMASANSKLVGMMLAGNTAWLPISGVIISSMGYKPLYVLMAVMNVVSLACYLMALGVAKKQGVTK